MSNYIAPSQPGQTHPKIPGAKRFLSRYSYGKGLGDSAIYTIEFGVALRTWAPKFNVEINQGRAGPKVPVNGEFDWRVQRQMGLDIAPGAKLKPLVLTCMGHLGNMVGGPDYLAARPLEVQERVQIQMVGKFDNEALPFRLSGQRQEINRLLHEPQLRLTERLWAASTHSRGALAFCQVWEQRDPNDPVWKNFRGGVNFGNPKRPFNVDAPWISDRPANGTEGLAPDCLVEAIPGMAEVTRRNDLYAEKIKGAKASELKVAIYQLVAYGRMFGRDSITEELLVLATQFGKVVWDLFAALSDGIQFVFNMDPHNVFDLRPATDHIARVLAV